MTSSSPRILVVSPAWIGDAVMAQSLLRHLVERHASAQLDVLAPAWTLPLFKRMPEIHQAIAFPFGHGELKFNARRQFAKTLKNQYDQAIILPNSLKSALVPFFASIPKRTGFIGECRYGLLNDARRLDKQALPLMVQRFASLAFPQNTPLPNPLLWPKLTTSPDQVAHTLKQRNIPTDRPFLALCPGAEYGSAKRWPALNFAALADKAIEAGYRILILGSEKDAPIGHAIQTISSFTEDLFNLCGKTSLEEAMDCLAATQAVVCNDSGLMHIAAALDRPLVALYGSSSPTFTPPLSHQATILSLDFPCSPCFKRECPRHPDAPPCLAQIDSGQVWEALKAFL